MGGITSLIEEDIIYSKETLPFHPNGMSFRAHTSKVFLSILIIQ